MANDAPGFQNSSSARSPATSRRQPNIPSRHLSRPPLLHQRNCHLYYLLNLRHLYQRRHVRRFFFAVIFLWLIIFAATDPFPSSDPLFSSSLSFDPTFSFGSEAANLEYSILSAILGKPSPESQPEASTNSPASAPPNPTDINPWDPSVFASGASTSATTFDTSPGGLYAGEDFPGANFLASPAMASNLQPGPAPTSAEQSSTSLESASQPLHPLAPRLPPSTPDSSYVFGPAAFDRHDGHAEIESPGIGAIIRGDEVYGAVTKAYDYTQGYHLLMQTIRHRWVCAPSIFAVTQNERRTDSTRMTSCALCAPWQSFARP